MATRQGVSFVVPFSIEDARVFWRDTVLPVARIGKRRVLLASLEGRLAGTVQIDLATPPNQRHRAEVMKLLVHPMFRRQGLARALMVALESVGYVTVGVIPRFARPSTTPGLEPTTIMYKELER